MKPVKHDSAGRQVEGDTEAGKKAMYERLMEERGLADSQIAKPSESPFKRNLASIWLSDAIRGFRVKSMCLTAGCGKPHVRWCGRVTGRNPRDSTRSFHYFPMRYSFHFPLVVHRFLPSTIHYPLSTIHHSRPLQIPIELLYFRGSQKNDSERRRK